MTFIDLGRGRYVVHDAFGRSTRLSLDGPLRVTLDLLISAGPRGCLPVGRASSRWEDHVARLRRAGLAIDREEEGSRARFHLRSSVTRAGERAR